jgi:hypothetical protein
MFAALRFGFLTKRTRSTPCGLVRRTHIRVSNELRRRVMAGLGKWWKVELEKTM